MFDRDTDGQRATISRERAQNCGEQKRLSRRRLLASEWSRKLNREEDLDNDGALKRSRGLLEARRALGCKPRKEAEKLRRGEGREANAITSSAEKLRVCCPC